MSMKRVPGYGWTIALSVLYAVWGIHLWGETGSGWAGAYALAGLVCLLLIAVDRWLVKPRVNPNTGKP